MAFNLPNCSYQRNDEERQPLICYAKTSTMVDDSTHSTLAFELPMALRQIELGATHRLSAEAAGRLHAIRKERHHLRFEWQSADGPYAVDALFRVGTDRDWFLDLPIPTGGLTVWRHRFEAGLEECGSQAAEFAEVSATMGKERPN